LGESRGLVRINTGLTPMNAPIVNIAVPVYNGALYLEECLDSILAQTHKRWRAFVVNNCSTDHTGRIADRYAQSDSRVCALHFAQFVGQGENYNRAVAKAIDGATYVKIVEADNRIEADCLARMLEIAESDSRIGVVGGYCVRGKEILGAGVDYHTHVLSGVEVWNLLFGVRGQRGYVLGTPTSLLFRASALQEMKPWFQSTLFYDDVDLCIRLLRKWAFGYVHQVVAYIRDDNNGLFDSVQQFDYWYSQSHFLAEDYGQDFMDENTLRRVRNEYLRKYYRQLARAILLRRKKTYWNFQMDLLRARGERLRRAELARALALEVIDISLNPKSSVQLLMRRLGRPLTDPGPRE
jgi:glycosyltransferase involved in cell wall biosynthesis